jgi:hypothetical protein
MFLPFFTTRPPTTFSIAFGEHQSTIGGWWSKTKVYSYFIHGYRYFFLDFCQMKQQKIQNSFSLIWTKTVNTQSRSEKQ